MKDWGATSKCPSNLRHDELQEMKEGLQRKTGARLGEGMSAEESDSQWHWKRGWGRRLVRAEVRCCHRPLLT